jgi:hypothetical protein
MIAVRITAAGRMAGAAAGLVLCVLAVAAALAPTAAAAPALTVTNLGQASVPSEVSQPPLGVSSRGSCPHPFTVAGESACPPGTWPPLGRPSWTKEGDRWSPTEDVAGGDTLQLSFSSPMAGVGVGSTSNFEPGLHDPDGNAIDNFDVISESPASATADPAVWRVTLPPLDYRALGGYTFSVVGSDAGGFYDYALEIRSPRFADESAKCGMAYFSTGVQQVLCFGTFPGSYPAPGPRAEKRKKCRHGFRRKKVHGKSRCVRVKKPHRKPHSR